MLSIRARLLPPLLACAVAAVVPPPSEAGGPGRNTGSYNLHLEDSLRFSPVQPGADPERGRALFGLGEHSEDALFEGYSAAAGADISSNGRTCFTCHRPDAGFGLPPPPLLEAIPANDPLFTGFDADAQGDPDAFENLVQLGLIKYRVNRFNPTRAPHDPFRQVFAWRKSPKLVNIALAHGLLTDGRGRVMLEAARGAAMSHTQDGDAGFPDLFPDQHGMDIEAFLAGQLSDPRLAALREPELDPELHRKLVRRPFHTVAIETRAQRRGAGLFQRQCMGCHDTPNVFNNLGNVEPLGNGERPVGAPSFAPTVARTYNVGVAECNRHGLRFTRYAGEGPGGEDLFEPILLSLAREDGSVEHHTVRFDVGLAAVTGRSEDVGRFKVPQLRNLADNAPYFHDNSAATIEEAVDHFLSECDRESTDGRHHPVRLNERQRQDLVEFLKIL